MKEVIIRDLNNKIISDKNLYEDPTEFLEINKKNNTWGKPERWVREKVWKEFAVLDNGDPNDGYWFPDEQYQDEDVIDTKTEIENEVEVKYVLLRADYTIEIIDLDTDYDYLLQECYKKRKAEYPHMEELADALFHKEQGNTSLYDSYIAKCEAVKLKYPKPEVM